MQKEVKIKEIIIYIEKAKKTETLVANTLGPIGEWIALMDNLNILCKNVSIWIKGHGTMNVSKTPPFPFSSFL